MLGGRAARIPVAQSVQAAAVHPPVDPGPRPRGPPDPAGGGGPPRGTRLCRRLGQPGPGAGCAPQLAPRPHQPPAGGESRHPAYGRGARDRGALLRGPGRVWRPPPPPPHDAVRICGGRHGHPVPLRNPARRGGGRPLLRRRGERDRRGTRAQRRHRHRARRPRLRAVAAFLPRPPHRRRHRDGSRAHEQLHRRQRGAVPLPSRVAAPSRGVLARGAGALPHGHGVLDGRRAPRGARRPRRRAAAPRRGRPLRGVRAVRTSQPPPTSTTSPAGWKGAVVCGIFGAVSLSGRPLRHPGCLRAMAAALAHRGPDGERIVGHERARVGARRLAIMDLTTGDQPFQSPDRSVWMACNGEIYNAPALRRECAAAGYPFRSKGDIETIVPLYARFGPDAVSRLEGMFGLAVWDDHSRRLILARDRAGEKPLFWTEIDGELRFASEIQALLVYPDQPRRVNPVATSLYAALGYVPGAHTMFAGISKVPAAHLLIADDSGLAVRRYWDPAAVAAREPRLTGPAELRDALLHAVERELMSDVPGGVFTSGGRDSSLPAAAAAGVRGGEKTHTFSVGFVDPGYDETPQAGAAPRHIRTIHHVVGADGPALERAFATITCS